MQASDARSHGFELEPNSGSFVQSQEIISNFVSVLAAIEQAELRRIARGFGKA
jgi:hypothetical protein